MLDGAQAFTIVKRVAKHIEHSAQQRFANGNLHRSFKTLHSGAPRQSSWRCDRDGSHGMRVELAGDFCHHFTTIANPQFIIHGRWFTREVNVNHAAANGNDVSSRGILRRGRSVLHRIGSGFYCEIRRWRRWRGVHIGYIVGVLSRTNR